MKAIVIEKFLDTLDDVGVSEVPAPEASADSILIQVREFCINMYASNSCKARGKHQNNKQLVRPPFVLGVEFSGIVIAAPKDAEYQKGDAVFGIHDGTYREVISVPREDFSSIRRVPDGWPVEAAAGLAAALPVAYDGLVMAGRIRAGDTVLVHSAAGGIGTMACQIAAALGCRVIGTAGSDAKCAYAKSFGAAECFNYTTDTEWWRRVRDANGGEGVDVVLDTVGLVEHSLRCTAPKGRIVVVGFTGSAENFEKIAMNRILVKQVELIGYLYGKSVSDELSKSDYIWQQLYPMLEHLSVKPTVTVLYDGLESVSRAIKDLAQRKICGKAVVRPGRATVHHL